MLDAGDTVMKKTGPALGIHRIIHQNLGKYVKGDIVEAAVRPSSGPSVGTNHLEQREMGR